MAARNDARAGSPLALRHFPVAELHRVAPEAMPPVLPGIELGRCSGDFWRIPRGEDNGLLGHAGLDLPRLDGLDLGGGQASAQRREILGRQEAVRPLLSRHAWVMLSHELDRDRKSTRLNSSHLVISYAVFCLKKKKNILSSQSTQTEPICPS